MTHAATRRLLGAPVLVALAVLAAGCGTDEEGAGPADRTPEPSATSTATEPSKPAKAYTVEQLAAALGCPPKFQGKAADFRQAACLVDGDTIILLQFDKAEGQRAWLEYATMYGGVYLAGDRWVLSGKSVAYMRNLQRKLGGSIEQSESG